MNFGYNFGVPRSEQTQSNSQNGNEAESQKSEYSIDLNQITPPTFRFGQFGQVSTEDANKVESVEDKQTDEDSFLAEPSMTAVQFDASFAPSADDFIFSPSNSAESVKSTKSTASVPTLIEEPLEQPVYLEEPAPHSVEELLKATVDGDMSAVMAESWENVDETEIKAAEAEFNKMTEVPANLSENPTVENQSSGEEVPVKKSKAPVVKKTKVEPAVLKEGTVVTEGRAKRERKTVERFADSVLQQQQQQATKTASVEKAPNGTGMKLGDIEAINRLINKHNSGDKMIVMLHRIIYNRMGDAAHRKANLRAFCGDETANYEDKLKKHTNADLKELAHFLGLTGANEKAALAAKISTFLVKPNIESVKFTAKGERIIKRVRNVAKPRPARSSKRINPDADKKPLGRPPKGSKPAKTENYLTPETVDSDVESEVEREVLGELAKNSKN